jgi:hypothetical protein
MDGQHLIGVDRKLAGEAGFACAQHIFLQSRLVAKINRECVNGLHLGMGRGQQAHGARQLEGEVKLAVFVFVGGGTHSGGQVFGTPGEARQPRTATGVAVELKQGTGHLSGHGNDLGRPQYTSFSGFKSTQEMVELHHITCIQRFGQHDAVRPSWHDRHQILQGVFCLQRVDANPDLLGTTRVVFQVVANHAACHRQTLDGHRIFQIKNERVGLGADTFGHFLSLSPGTNSRDRSSFIVGGSVVVL